VKHEDNSIIEQGIETMFFKFRSSETSRAAEFTDGKTTVHASHFKALTPGGHWGTMSWNHRIATQLVPIHARCRTDNGSKQFPAMHV